MYEHRTERERAVDARRQEQRLVRRLRRHLVQQILPHNETSAEYKTCSGNHPNARDTARQRAAEGVIAGCDVVLPSALTDVATPAATHIMVVTAGAGGVDAASTTTIPTAT